MATVNSYTKISDSGILHYAIEYKEINEDDFKGTNVRKEILDIDENQYLSDIAYNNINLDEHNTVVINSSVGQGKSNLARKITKDYFMARDADGRPLFTVIFAVPYKSLIEQYIDDIKSDLLKEGIEDLNIPDYMSVVDLDKIDNEEDRKFHIQQAASERIHILTVNCLLANAGENAFEQNFIKRGYLEKIIEINRDEDRKVVIVFDEIHDAIHNFRQDLIFYLWRFRANYILHKSFILSATFNEASKIVIKYISELTSNNLQIIETKRIQIKKNLSNLHIHLTKDDDYDFEKDEFKELFERIIKKHNTLNILSYSRKLCSDIIEGTNGKSVRDLLFSKYSSKINICIAKEHHLSSLQKKKRGIPDEITYSEKYIRGLCNIGTTFRTGISLKDENSGYVVILPSARAAMQEFAKNGSFGIFTNRIISLIQALARPRIKTDIYVVMPYPKQYIEEYHGYIITPDNYMSKLMDIDIFKSHLLRNHDKAYLHYNFSDQHDEISQKYNGIKKRIKREINWVDELNESKKRDFLPYLQYPSIEMFILDKGELFLNTKYAIWGKDLSAYMIWAAFTNQFVNCKLVQVSSTKVKEKIDIDNVQDFLFTFFQESYNISPCNLKMCDLDIYFNLYSRIILKYNVHLKEGITDTYKSINSTLLRKHIMSFIQKFMKGNRSLNSKYMKIITNDEDGTFSFEDIKYEVGDYLLCSISNSLIYDKYKDQLNKKGVENNNLIVAYQNLRRIHKLFVEKLILPFENEIGYIYPQFKGYSNNLFNEKDIELIINVFKVINNDYNFKIFVGKNGINFTSTDTALTSIYNLLKGTFFETDEFREPNGARERKLIIKKIIPLPEQRTGINLLYKYKYMKNENYEKEILEEIASNEHNMPKWGDGENCPTTLIKDENGNLVILEEQEKIDKKS